MLVFLYLSIEQDCDKKIEDYSKSIQTCKKDLETLRKQFSIVGDNIKRALVDKLKELPKIYEDVVNNAKNLKKGNNYFSKFVAHISGTDVNLPMLQYIIST